MSQAVLILAHRDFEQIYELSLRLKQRFLVYIHFDKKMILTPDEKSRLESEGINYISEVDVKWGGWSIVEATIRLIRFALRDGSIKFFHLISGQDWPIKNVDEIYRYFEDNSDKIFLDVQSVKNIKKSGEPVEWWLKYYYNYDKINRRSFSGKIFHRLNISVQTIFRINKFKKLDTKVDFYTGSQWFDVPREVLVYALNYLEKNDKLYKLFKTSFCSDEFWLNTIVMNNDVFKERITENNHRFMKWIHKNGSYPAILDEDDYLELKTSDAFFARKFTKEYSKQLIIKLDEVLKKD
ncbi:beta-1,6-N-acetylglucosaminyltransferase [Ligilactobacillus salivarius]|uniref:beta-1,6-N-acetylglucosaminyltransferase n=1 Tax=Ligilactobacillus salivarius TaxID=1624 RepID=UPI001F5B157E|nr:beta-1,6-N-acetylglucosaminyltransferase [Ligilactobacillus salivarius]